jgi:hypothetical protein
VRNRIPPQMLIPRILVAGIVTAAIYLPAMYFMKLPGWEVLSRERLLGMVRSQLGKLRGAAA